jgi:hypothetical protein
MNAAAGAPPRLLFDEFLGGPRYPHDNGISTPTFTVRISHNIATTFRVIERASVARSSFGGLLRLSRFEACGRIVRGNARNKGEVPAIIASAMPRLS